MTESSPVSPSVDRLIEEIDRHLNKITPGEWVADNFAEEDDACTRVGTSDGTEHYYHRSAVIAFCERNDRDDERDAGEPLIGLARAEANAAFIAAAPRLLASARRVLVQQQEALKTHGLPVQALAEQFAHNTAWRLCNDIDTAWLESFKRIIAEDMLRFHAAALAALAAPVSPEPPKDK